MENPSLNKTETYLRYLEKELMIGGGRWIATFNIAIRDFNVNKMANPKKSVEQSSHINTLIYGGVRNRGFILSRAFSFMASPTYRVGCAAITVKNPTNLKWSGIVTHMRDVTTIKREMEFEWIWVLLFGVGSVSPKVSQKIQTHVSRELGLLYADLKGKEIYNSDGFIARHGAKLFHPNNLDKKPTKLKFWKN